MKISNLCSQQEISFQLNWIKSWAKLFHVTSRRSTSSSISFIFIFSSSASIICWSWDNTQFIEWRMIDRLYAFLNLHNDNDDYENSFYASRPFNLHTRDSGGKSISSQFVQIVSSRETETDHSLFTLSHSITLMLPYKWMANIMSTPQNVVIRCMLWNGEHTWKRRYSWSISREKSSNSLYSSKHLV